MPNSVLKFLPEGGLPLLARDGLFGKAGCKGCSTGNRRLQQISSALSATTRVGYQFQEDVVKPIRRWLPSTKARSWRNGIRSLARFSHTGNLRLAGIAQKGQRALSEHVEKYFADGRATLEKLMSA